jgi:uncharacterized tellurite resistance protein B-like protein
MKLLSTETTLKIRRNVPNIKNGCLECDGNLVPYQQHKEVKLLGKKIYEQGKPSSYIYKCDACGNTFLPSVKYNKFLDQEERGVQANSNNDIYARLMVASLVHTALADGRFAAKEDELLEMVLLEAKEFPSTKAVMEKVFELGGDATSYVFSVFDYAKQHLSRERLESVIVANARMILVDGQIKKPEEKLLKRYMSLAGLTKPMAEILRLAHDDQYKGGVSRMTTVKN